MENSLQNILEKSDEREGLYQKLFDENEHDEARDRLFSLLEKVCKSCHNPMQTRSPQPLIELAKLFRFFGDCHISSELIRGAASLAILNFASEIKIIIKSHEGKRRFTRAISVELGLLFGQFKLCHTAFYTNRNDKDDVEAALNYLETFLNKLNNVNLDELTKTNLFNERYKYV